MIHFIRNNKNETIIDIESMKDDISCFIDIVPYSEYLLSLDSDLKKFEWIQDMSDIQEIRGFFFEREKEKTSRKLAEYWCKEICQKWNLHYIED